MKNRVLISMIIAILTIFSAVSFAADVRVQLDGEYLDFTDANGDVVNPQIINNRTMVPMRKIFETYGAQISWDDATRTVVATTEGKEITLTINSEVATVKDLSTGMVETVALDSVPVIVNNRTLVPLRFISEGLDKTVGWDNDERVAIIIDFAKLAELYSSKLPALQALIEMGIEDVSSYRSVSDLNMTMDYKDLEDDSQNETITLAGKASVALSKEEDLDANLAFHVSGGTGDIMNAFVEGGLQDVDLRLVLLDGRVYLGIKDGDEYLWTDKTDDLNNALGGMVDISQLGNGTVSKSISNISDYSDFVRLLSNYIGDLNVNTYASLVSAANMVASLFDEDTLAVTKTGDGAGLFRLNLDINKLVSKIAPAGTSALPGANIVFTLECNIENHRIQSEKTNIIVDYVSEESLESLGLNIGLDTVYTDVNNDVVIDF